MSSGSGVSKVSPSMGNFNPLRPRQCWCSAFNFDSKTSRQILSLYGHLKSVEATFFPFLFFILAFFFNNFFVFCSTVQSFVFAGHISLYVCAIFQYIYISISFMLIFCFGKNAGKKQSRCTFTFFFAPFATLPKITMVTGISNSPGLHFMKVTVYTIYSKTLKYCKMEKLCMYLLCVHCVLCALYFLSYITKKQT